jgi:ribosomal protein S18 acetylase RimI-like enzyme
VPDRWHGGNLVYRPLRTADLGAAAALHRAVFSDHFLGHMDRRFLELFYGEFVAGPGELGWVAERDGRLVGATIGTTDAPGMYARFYRRHLPRLAALVLRAAVGDPYVRRAALGRLPHVALAVRSRLGLRPTVADRSGSEPAARLLSIGVAEAERGSGVAGGLVEAFCRALADRGIDRVGLSVHNDNSRAIAFYEKTGWRRIQSDAAGTSFWRPTRQP